MIFLLAQNHFFFSIIVACLILMNFLSTGVLYFGDDDNSFDLRLFSEIRYTQRVSMFPVGLIGDYSISAPIVKNVSEQLIIYHVI